MVVGHCGSLSCEVVYPAFKKGTTLATLNTVGFRLTKAQTRQLAALLQKAADSPLACDVGVTAGRDSLQINVNHVTPREAEEEPAR
jgi:hypothetical protein